MSAYRAKPLSFAAFTAFTAVLAWTPSPAFAQTLALPPSADAKPATPAPAPTPADVGLALPPTSSTPAPAAPATPTPAIGLALPAPAPTAQAVQTPGPIAVPVEAEKLSDVKSDSIGLIGNGEGGLGAGLWKGSQRVTVERFLPMLSPPLPFASLNNLARRFLLTTAGAPEGEGDASSKQALTSARIDRLVSLGDAADAWKLANLPGFEAIDDAVLRRTAEAALVSSAGADVCARLPELVKQHTAIEWQKLMVVCQLRAKDPKAAQVSLDLLHAQDVHDETFYTLAEKNVMAGSKQLPRQLTPLTPLMLALLRMADQPLRTEIYTHPDAALIPELLKAKPVEESARIALGERAAAKGLIDVKQLEDIYSSQTFAPDAMSNAMGSLEHGPVLRALLYQAARQEKDAKARIAMATKFFASLDTTNTGGGVLSAMGSMLGDVQPANDSGDEPSTVLRLLLLAGKEHAATEWMDAARTAAATVPSAAIDLQRLWPLTVLAGLESDASFMKNENLWLSAAILRGAADDADAKAQKTAAASLLLLMDADGFPVSDVAWARVADTAAPERTQMPPALILERLRASAAAGRKGEAVLMGLLASMGSKEEPPVLAIAETVRALRAVGLPNDASAVAREEAMRIMYPPPKP